MLFRKIIFLQDAFLLCNRQNHHHWSTPGIVRKEPEVKNIRQPNVFLVPTISAMLNGRRQGMDKKT